MSREKNTTPTVRTRAPRKSAATAARPATGIVSFVGPEQRAELIAKAAYFRAEQRGFAPGHEMSDWLAAEAEVDARLLRAASAPRA
jgi:hypothetical protein